MAVTSQRPGSKTKRLAQERLYRLIYENALESDTSFLEEARRAVPEAWHLVEMDIDIAEPKEKLTLYLDRSVARVFKGMGRGYQRRINRVLATWAQMKMAELKVLEMGYYEALEATFVERDAEVPQDLRDRRAGTLENHWAYLQGFEDGKLEGKG